MAGRGTDIMLGGNAEMLIKDEFAKVENEAEREKIATRIRAKVEEDKKKVLESGGLFVLGTERHESRRIDNQLRGRSGRQGDPGESRFFLSLEDDLMRIFGSQRIDGLLQKLGLKEGEAIYHPWMTRALEKAQTKVEGRNFEIRKNLLKFDDVMNDQRKIIYEQRREIMQTEDVSETVQSMREEVLEALVSQSIPAKSYHEEWQIETLTHDIHRIFGLNLPIADWAKEEGTADQEILEHVRKAVSDLMESKEARFTPRIMRVVEKRVLLQTLDQLWKEHLHTLDHLRQGISLRAYGQRDPLNEYKLEAFNLFEGMLSKLREETTHHLSHIEVHVDTGDDEEIESLGMIRRQQRMTESRVDPSGFGSEEEPHERDNVTPIRTRTGGDRVSGDPNTWGRVGRNDPCPCGSGKKFKQCHGALE